MANYTSSYTGQDLDYSIKLTKGSVAPAFSTSSTYAVGDFVIYNGDLYQCITAVTTAGAWDSTKWETRQIIEVAEGSGVTGVKGASESTYRKGDVNLTLGNFGVSASATELNTLRGITASTTELNYAKGVTSAIQTQLNAKQATLATQTAYTSKGSATKVPQITTNTLGQVTGITEVTITQPTVNNKTITINKNGTKVDSFTLNQSTDKTINIPVTLADVGITASATEVNYTTGVTSGIQGQLDNKLETSLKGANNGLAELGADGKVPTAQLPAFVDDVIEGYLYNGKFYSDSAHTQEITPETGKIYVDLHTNKTYRWSGTQYTEISASLALGETSTTAYRGDRGKTAYDHSQITSGNPHGTTLANLGVNASATELNYVKGVTSAVQTQLNAKQATISDLADIRSNASTGATHAAVTTGNPHGVTKSDVGLGNVVNTGDSATPVSGGTTKFTTGGAYTELAKKVTANTAITGATKTKITYDSKGLVTAGADLAATDIPDLPASKITSGTLDSARIPSLAASKITSGTFDAARIPNLDASKINSGTFADARIASASTWNAKSTVSVAATGTATDEIQYITVDGTEKKIKGEPEAYLKSASSANNTLTLTKKDNSTITFTPADQVDVVNGTTPAGTVEIWIDESKNYGESDWGSIVQTTGTATDKVMSQNAVTTAVNAKSTVSVNATGTSTDTVRYITVDNVEYKLDGGGSGGDAVWGSITGTLSNQTDLQAALDAKQNQLHSYILEAGD